MGAARTARRDGLGEGTAEPDARQRRSAILRKKRSRRLDADKQGACQQMASCRAGGRAEVLFVSMHDTSITLQSTYSRVTWFRKMAQNLTLALKVAKIHIDLTVLSFNVIPRSIKRVSYSGQYRSVLSLIPCAWRIFFKEVFFVRSRPLSAVLSPRCRPVSFILHIFMSISQKVLFLGNEEASFVSNAKKSSRLVRR